MNHRYWIPVVAALTLVTSVDARALTADEFAAICDSTPGDCTEHPLLQAYVGGALDMVATLDEHTDYLSALYCKKAGELFRVPAIIRYVRTHAEKFSGKNAMLAVVRYLEEEGGCE